MALKNKLGITNSAELAREEERISKKKAVSGRVCFRGIVFVILIVARGHTEIFRALGLIQSF